MVVLNGMHRKLVISPRDNDDGNKGQGVPGRSSTATLGRCKDVGT